MGPVGCAGKLEAMHSISRSAKMWRHHPLNGTLGCTYHHKWHVLISCHKGPIGYAIWLRERHPDRFAFVEDVYHGRISQTDSYRDSYEKLIGLIRELKEKQKENHERIPQPGDSEKS